MPTVTSRESMRLQSSEVRWRFRFTLVTILATLLLIAWGAFVTSIGAGLAVPDWPTSFGSWNQLNPWPQWWTLDPVLAEHGHRLIGAVVGLLTLILAVWTYLRDSRKAVRNLAVAAFILVCFQGLLGGLRVVWVSLDLAVIHACFAQVYFATLVAIAVHLSPPWLDRPVIPESNGRATRLRSLMPVIVGILFIQILLGALLRHPGAGIDFTLAMFHIGGAVLATASIIYTARLAFVILARDSPVRRGLQYLLGLLAVQVTLGFIAYFVLLDAGGRIQPSNFQVIVNGAHVVTGALLFGAAVATAIFARQILIPSVQSFNAARSGAERSSEPVTGHGLTT